MVDREPVQILEKLKELRFRQEIEEVEDPEEATDIDQRTAILEGLPDINNPIPEVMYCSIQIQTRDLDGHVLMMS